MDHRTRRSQRALTNPRKCKKGAGRPFLATGHCTWRHRRGVSSPFPGAPTVLTPHEGELARLLDIDSDAVKARRLEHVRAAAAQSQAIVLLKGDDTLVAEPGGLVAVSPGATAALATAGTGDVLSGVIGAVLSRGLDPFAATCAAARLHARAGIHAAGERASMASSPAT